MRAGFVLALAVGTTAPISAVIRRVGMRVAWEWRGVQRLLHRDGSHDAADALLLRDLFVHGFAFYFFFVVVGATAGI